MSSEYYYRGWRVERAPHGRWSATAGNVRLSAGDERQLQRMIDHKTRDHAPTWFDESDPIERAYRSMLE